MTTHTKNDIQITEDFNVQDFLQTCLHKWYWFAISLLITLGVATYKIKTTHPTYTRYTDLLIKTSDQGSMGGQMEKFASMGAFSGNTTVYNEIYALQSPANIAEMVKKLNLDMEYTCDGQFHSNVLYGSNLPIKATLCDIPQDAFASFTIDLHKDGTYKLYNFSSSHIDEIDENAIAHGRLSITTENTQSDTVSTPIGKIHIAPSPHYIQNDDITIYVSRSSIYNAAGRYSGCLSFTLKDKDADVITIAINDHSIERADDILETLIKIYNKKWVDDKNTVAIETEKFINERLEYISKELETVDSNISSYKSKHLLPDVSVATSMYMSQNREINNKILDLNNELEMSYAINNYLTNEATKNKILPTNVGIRDVGIGEQIANYNRNMLQRNSLVANSSIHNPLVIELDNTLASLRQAIIASINNQIQALGTQISNLQKEERQTNERISQNPMQSKYLASEGREQTVKETLYLFLLQKREENQLSQAFTAYNTRIITPPSGSIMPTGPVKQKIWLIALAIGLLIPIAIILIRDYMNTKIRGHKDLENVSMPIIGEIPLAYKQKRKIQIQRQNRDIKIVIQNGNRNIINEAFRVLRTNIEFMQKDKNRNIFICTSFNSGSGKSFIMSNLAASLALKGKSILLIDGDMRHASLSTLVKSPKQGLSNYLAGMVDNPQELIINIELFDKLHIIPAGTIPPNPTELLEDERFESLLEQMRTKYDYILIDCPPIDIVADTAIIEKSADRTIFIVRAGLLERNMVPELETLYQSNRFKNVSLVLNGIEEKHGRYGYRHGYGYDYHYQNK